MQKVRRGLGRGLSALIPDADMDFLTRIARGDANDTSGTKSALRTQKEKASTVTNKGAKSSASSTFSQQPLLSNSQELQSLSELVPIEQIEANPYQPRRTFSDEEMQDLSNSVKQHGVLQPILLRPIEATETSSSQNMPVIQYQLIAGERRWRASQNAGLSEIPAIIRHVSDQQALELAVIENVQRHDISALDAANAYRRLSQEFSLSQEQIAQRVGKSRVSISNTIRLLDLPADVQKAIADGTLTEGHGRAILLADTDGARRAVFRRVLRDKLSVRATEEIARVTRPGEADGVPESSSDDAPGNSQLKNHSIPEIRRIEETLQKRLGTRVRIRPRKRGGQVVIQYFSNEELERLLKTMLRQ